MAALSPARQDALVRAMPVVFVLIWSTGFIVARYGMPHAPPMKFLAMRYLLSAACFAVWAVAARPAWPVGASQLRHLAVTGLLMHAGYLGGVWAAVKLGMGAGLVALLVGLQPVLTALWLSAHGGRVGLRQWQGLALGFGGLALVVWQKLGLGEIHGTNLLLAGGALLSITAGTLYQKRFVTPCDVRTASLVQLAAAFAVTLGGSSLLYLLIQRGAATAVTSLFYLVPPCTAVTAWLLFDEPITAMTVAGVVLAAFGVSLVVRGTPPEK